MDTDHVTAEKELARQIADEFYADSTDTEVCYRDGRRYRAYLDERTADAVNQKELSFPSDQVLLITGGQEGLEWCVRVILCKHTG